MVDVLIMIDQIVTIKSDKGIHARHASEIVKAANKFKSKIKLMKIDGKFNVGYKADAKSIIGIISMAMEKDSKILIEAIGIDERKALEFISKILLNEYDIVEVE
jgi:phosphocarrier protein HPr